MFILLKASQIFHKMQPQMVVSLIIILTCIMPGMQQFVDCESAGGSVEPLLCIIVPFRDGCGWHGYDRSSQLDFFLAQMTKWLTDRGHTSFRFVVSEQSQRGLFNKGLLFNIGALAAFSEGCEHLVFHDVDQLPQNPRNDYFYTGHPTHLCTWSSQYPSNWKGMRPHVGGALMMSRSDYIAVNGFANRYWRWGLEDSDMYHRIYTVLKDLVRLPQEIGNYSAIEHLRVDTPGQDESLTRPYARQVLAAGAGFFLLAHLRGWSYLSLSALLLIGNICVARVQHGAAVELALDAAEVQALGHALVVLVRRCVWGGCVRVCMYICVYMCMYVCVCVCIYIYIHTVNLSLSLYI